MMRILVLDDDDIRHEQFAVNLVDHDVKHVRTVEEAGNALANDERYDLAFLDHDLNDFGGDACTHRRVEQTGMDVARFIARYLAPQKRPARVVVHSWNTSAAPRMVRELVEAGIPAIYEPFGGSSGLAQAWAPPQEDPNWVTVDTLVELKEHFDDQMERMQTPEARDEEDDERPSKECPLCGVYVVLQDGVLEPHLYGLEDKVPCENTGQSVHAEASHEEA